MKILVFSDTHGNKDSLEFIFNNFKFDALFFLGDGLKDLSNFKLSVPIYKVKGNCDFFSNVNTQELIKLENKNILLTHGNEYGVKYTYDNIIEYVKDKNIDLVCFGHSHKPITFTKENTTFVNPGTLSKNDKNKGIAIITLSNNKISVLPITIQ